MIFDGFPGGPGAEHARLKVFGSSLGLIAVTKQYGVAPQHAKYNIKHAGRKGYEKTRMQTEEIQKSRLQYDFIRTERPGHRLEGILRSLVAPLPRRRRIY